MAGRDDDALSWGGDDDPTLDVGVPAEPRDTRADAPAPRAVPASGTNAPAARAVPASGTDAPAAEASADAAPVASSRGRGRAPRSAAPRETATGTEPSTTAPMDNVTLVSLGVLGGIYLLLAVGWFIGGARLQFVAQLFLDPAGYLVAWAIAVLAPAIWFVTVLVLTRGRRAWLRMVLLAVGAIALLPWPFLLVGVGA